MTSMLLRRFPVILLLDSSGSMLMNGKIDTLNQAVNETLDTFKRGIDEQTEIYVAAIVFGGEGAELRQSFQPALEASWEDLTGYGRTHLGGAFTLAAETLEDFFHNDIYGYKPVLILFSDGSASDDWRAPLQRLLEVARAKKIDRFALRIGCDVDEEILNKFVGDGKEGGLFPASEACQLVKFFRIVTIRGLSQSDGNGRNGDSNSSDLDRLG